MRRAFWSCALLLACLGHPLTATEETTASEAEETAADRDRAFLEAARKANLLYQQRIFLLERMLEHEEEERRLHAMRQLGQLDDRTVIPALLPFLDHDLHSTAEVATAITVLSHLGSAEAAVKMRELAALPDAELREAAVYGLHMMEAMGLDDYRLQLPTRPEAIKASAIVGVGELQDAESGQVLVEALAKDNRNFIRRRAAIALGRLGMEQYGPALATAMSDPDPMVRRRAAEAMTALDYKPGIPKLIMAIDSNIASLELYRCLVILSGVERPDEVFGFSPYDGRFERRQAVERMFAWWTAHKGEFGGAP